MLPVDPKPRKSTRVARLGQVEDAQDRNRRKRQLAHPPAAPATCPRYALPGLPAAHQDAPRAFEDRGRPLMLLRTPRCLLVFSTGGGGHTPMIGAVMPFCHTRPGIELLAGASKPAVSSALLFCCSRLVLTHGRAVNLRSRLHRMRRPQPCGEAVRPRDLGPASAGRRHSQRANYRKRPQQYTRGLLGVGRWLGGLPVGSGPAGRGAACFLAWTVPQSRVA